MPGCVFRAYGRDFDVDAFLAKSSLNPYDVYHQGEVPSKSHAPFEDSGLSVDVSQADGCIEAECRDAIDWLTANMAELERLAGFPGVDSLDLCFGYYLRKNVAAQFDHLPRQLVKLAAQASIGIDLALYAWVADEPEEAKDS